MGRSLLYPRRKNVVGLGAFKSYFGLWFHQGALLADKNQVLINCQEGKTKALRQWRMTDKKEIDARTINAYIKEANASFKALTKGKQREYADYIADAKREETKLKRLDKIVPMIEADQGLNDRYRKC